MGLVGCGWVCTGDLDMDTIAESDRRTQNDRSKEGPFTKGRTCTPSIIPTCALGARTASVRPSVPLQTCIRLILDGSQQRQSTDMDMDGCVVAHSVHSTGCGTLHHRTDDGQVNSP